MSRAELLEPPRLATWLLNQFASVVDTSLSGDLVESFQERGSRAWYWRQVLLAIVIAFPRLLRKQWGRLVYAACFSVFMFTLPRWSRIPFELWRASLAFQWPWSFVSVIALASLLQTAIVGVALLGDFSFSYALRRVLQSHMPEECRCSNCGLTWTPYTDKATRLLYVRNLPGAFAIVMAVLVSGNIALRFLSALGDSPLSAWYFALAASVLWALQTALAFLLGIWWIKTGGRARKLSPTQA